MKSGPHPTVGPATTSARIDGLGLAGKLNVGVADGAVPPSDDVLGRRMETQDSLAPIGAVEAGLTDVVLRLRRDWISVMGASWPSICAVGEAARDDFEQRVASLLREGFFCFGQFLCGLEVVLLERQKLGVVCEETVLGVQQRGVHLADLRRHLVEVSKAESGFPDFLGGVDGSDGAADERKIHGNPPAAGQFGCSYQDSTAGDGSTRKSGGST